MFGELDDNDKLYLGALSAFLDGRYGDAIPALAELVEQNPQDLDSLQLLAYCYSECGDELRALLALKQAQKIEPLNSRILAQLGKTYCLLNLDQFAIETLNQAIKLGELDETIYCCLSLSYFRVGDKERAGQVLIEGLRINPSWTQLLYQLGIHHLYMKEFSKAYEIGQQLKNLEYPLADDFLRMIEEDSPERDQIEMSKFKEEAKQLLREGEQLLIKRKYKEAACKLISAIKSDDQLAMAYTHLGKILDDYGLIDEGLSLHKRAIQIDPNLAPAYNNLGYVLQLKGENQKAIEAYKKTLEIDPKMVEAHNNIGFLYDTLGEYEKGLEHFQKALEIDPKRPTTLMNMAYAYWALGRIEESLETYQKVHEYYPTYPRPKFFMGEIYKELENYEKAESEYLQALNIDPEFMLAWFRLAQCYFATGQNDKFRSAMEKALSIHPRYSDEIFLFAQLMEIVDKEKGIEWWEKYIQMADKYPMDPEQVNYARNRLILLQGTKN